MDVREYSPKSSLVVLQPTRRRGRNTHSSTSTTISGFPMAPERSKQLLDDMDSINLQIMVNLSGGYGDRLKSAVDFARATAPKRFAVGAVDSVCSRLFNLSNT
ncbi:MAG: hypothetical protein MZV70_19390 [Desulfobacterales bacterium]|nr:hypothetical protein [Desulfobacterales bacterium]